MVDIEKLFFQYGADLELWTHEHNYERLWPVDNKTVSTLYLRSVFLIITLTVLRRNRLTMIR
jgi:hypothetical protein